jgi:hypothetical protein
MGTHMKGIIVGIAVALFLCGSSLSTAHQTTQPTTPILPLDDNVPVWTVGNSWTYAISNFSVNYDQDGQKMLVNGRIDDFTWTVTDTSDSTYYTVNLTGKLTASYDISFSSIQGTKHFSGTLKPRLHNLKGTILFTKSDLQIHTFSAVIKGLSKTIIAPLTFAIPFPMKITANGQMNKDFPLFDFPLSSTKYWSLSNFDATIQASAGGIFGLIQIPISISIQQSWFPWIFQCQGTQDVTVPAGTYNAYHISSTFGDYFDYYYAPAVGNLIKIDATLQNGAISGELTSFTYP